MTTRKYLIVCPRHGEYMAESPEDPCPGCESNTPEVAPACGSRPGGTAPRIFLSIRDGRLEAIYSDVPVAVLLADHDLDTEAVNISEVECDVQPDIVHGLFAAYRNADHKSDKIQKFNPHDA